MTLNFFFNWKQDTKADTEAIVNKAAVADTEADKADMEDRVDTNKVNS